MQYPGLDVYPSLTSYPMPNPEDYGDWLSWQATTLTQIQPDDLDIGTEYEIQVRAVSRDGVASDWSPSVWFVTPSDAEPPATPSAPLVTSRLGTFTISWDGHTATGGIMPPDFSHVKVYAGSTFVGSIQVPSDSVVWSSGVQYNTSYSFTLVAVDTSGNESLASTSATGTVTPLVDTDLIGKIVAGANIKDGTINAADKIIAETITGSLIQAGAIKAGHLDANSVTADAISVGALDGMIITGGELHGQTFYSGSRTAWDDLNQGWYIAADGFANIRDANGNAFITISPRLGEEYFRIGEPDAPSYLQYDALTGNLTVAGTYKSDRDGQPRLVMANDLWADTFVGMHFQVDGTDTGRITSIKANTVDNGYPVGTLFLTSAQNPQGPLGIEDRGEIRIASHEIWSEVADSTGANRVIAQAIYPGANDGRFIAAAKDLNGNTVSQITAKEGWGSSLEAYDSTGVNRARARAAPDGGAEFVSFDGNGVWRGWLELSNDHMRLQTQGTGGNLRGKFEVEDNGNTSIMSYDSSGLLRSSLVMGNGVFDLDYFNSANGWNYGKLHFESTGVYVEGHKNGNRWSRLVTASEPQGTSYFRVYDTDAVTPLAGVMFGQDGSGARVWFDGFYNRTYSDAPNVFITSSGTVGRSTSASKYKVNIQGKDFGDAVLSLEPKVWYDKTTTEAWASMLDSVDGDLAKITDDELAENDIPNLREIPGLIAEDVAGAGLTDFVSYGPDGEIEGLQYDRLWVPLIPIIRGLRDEVATLKSELQLLKESATL